MPNWIYNSFTFNNAEDFIKVYNGMMKKVKIAIYDEWHNITDVKEEEKWSFRGVRDFPEKPPEKYLLKEDDPVGFDINCPNLNWYNWCIDNWGCKWDASSITIEEDTNTIYFSTPWSAISDDFFDAIKEKFGVEIEFDWWSDEDIEEDFDVEDPVVREDEDWNVSLGP